MVIPTHYDSIHNTLDVKQGDGTHPEGHRVHCDEVTQDPSAARVCPVVQKGNTIGWHGCVPSDSDSFWNVSSTYSYPGAHTQYPSNGWNTLLIKEARQRQKRGGTTIRILRGIIFQVCMTHHT